MKKLIAILAICFFTSSVYAKNNAGEKTNTIPTSDVSITMNSENVDASVTEANKEIKEGNFFTIENNKTHQKWTMSFGEFKQLNKRSKNWVRVSTEAPVIKEMYEDGDFVYIVFNYYDEEAKDYMGIKINKNESILSGKVLIHKKYLVSPDSAKLSLTFYKDLAGGLTVYSIITTVLIIILIH